MIFRRRQAATTGRSGLRAAGAALAGLLALTGIIAAPAAALAAPEDNQVRIDDVSFENDTIEDWTRQRLTVEWSIPAEAVAPVSLSLPLPEELHGLSDTFPMMGPDDQVAGECVVTETEITCTVDDAFIEANPYEVSGSFFIGVETRLDNREEVEKTFVFGEIEREVVVTPNRNWCTENCEFSDLWGGKYGWYNKADDTIEWTVQVPAGENGIPAGQEITVTDLLDEEDYELLVDGTYPRVLESSTLQYDRWGRESVSGWQVRDAGVAWSNGDLTATFDSREGRGSDWRNDIDPPAQGAQRGVDGSFYIVQWKVKALTGGEIQPNGDRVFRNAAEWSIDGNSSNPTTGSATRYTSGGNVMSANYGRFAVTKELTGDTTLNPEFTVNYTVAEPGQEPAERSFTVRAGETFTSPEFFRGTVVELTEVKPTDPANVNWADPVFLDASGEPVETVTFTPGGNGTLGALTEIRLVNEATLQTGSFSAQKSVVNEDGVPLADDLTFALDYTYPADAEKGFSGGSGTLELPISGDVVSSGDLPVGAEVTLTEANLPNVPGATWGEPVIDPTTLTIGESEEPVTAQVTNTITQDTGGFSVTKSISGDGAGLVPEDATFTVSYEYPEINGFPAGNGEISFGAGETGTVDGIPAGATITLTELEIADPEGGTWGDPDFSESTFTVVKDTVVSIDLDNPISWNDGDFSVLKQISGDGADLVAPEAAFTVDYTYTLPEALGADPATGSGTLTVLNNGETVTSDPLPYGTEVTLSEAAPVAVPGGTWTGYEFDNPTFTIGDQTTFAVELTNAIERDLGGFSVTKAVSGSGAELVSADTEFTVEYSYPEGEWYPAGEGTLSVKNGETASVDGIPASAVVTLTEVAPEDPKNGHWVSASFTEGNIAVIEKDAVSGISLENVVALGEGGFTVQKSIAGAGADLVDPGATFVVDYAYDAGVGFEAGSGQITVTADGTPTSVTGLPAGAEVRLTEETPVDIDGAHWVSAAFSDEVIVIGQADDTEVSLTNTIEPDEPGTPNEPGTPGTPGESGDTSGQSDGGLVNTGAASLLWIGIAAVLAALGTAFIWKSRRKGAQVN